jgi:hypothetical protein
MSKETKSMIIAQPCSKNVDQLLDIINKRIKIFKKVYLSIVFQTNT